MHFLSLMTQSPLPSPFFQELVEKDGRQVSPTSITGRLPVVGEEMEVEEETTFLVTRPILAWGMDDSSTSCCHRCSDLEVKLVQCQKEVEHARRELEQAWQEQEQAQRLLEKSEHGNSQTKPTDTGLQQPQESESQPEQMEKLRHYINKYNECQKKLQEKSEELSECQKELDIVSNQLHKAAEQKYRLSEELRAWQVSSENAGCLRESTLRAHSLETQLTYSRNIIWYVIFAVSIPNVWGQSISWRPRVCSHELLELSVTQREKSIDVHFISISASVCEL